MLKPSHGKFDRLISPHLGRLFRMAYRLAGNAADAEDLVQDACVIGCENLVTLARAEHADRWLMRALYNRFVDKARRRQRSPVSEFDLGPEAAALGSRLHCPETLAEQSDAERDLEYACSKLSATQRALLSLRAEGYGLAEIEQITGIGRDVLRARLHRARLSLSRHLQIQNDEAEQRLRQGSQL